MFKKKDEETPAPTDPQRDEHAYEDNWYRSLKALAAQADEGRPEDIVDEPSTPALIHEPGETPASSDAPVESEMPVRDDHPVTDEMPTVGEVPVVDEVPAFDEVPAVDGAPAFDDVPAPTIHGEALETRASQLLERLRALQHLGDPEPDDQPSAEATPSVWG